MDLACSCTFLESFDGGNVKCMPAFITFWICDLSNPSFDTFLWPCDHSLEGAVRPSGVLTPFPVPFPCHSLCTLFGRTMSVMILHVYNAFSRVLDAIMPKHWLIKRRWGRSRSRGFKRTLSWSICLKLSCAFVLFFSVAAPRLWNHLPTKLKSCHSITRFKSLLKTHIMSQFFKDDVYL